jgi:hypothetical protein
MDAAKNSRGRSEKQIKKSISKHEIAKPIYTAQAEKSPLFYYKNE